MVVDVTDAKGKPVKFTPFYGALAHAIFFRDGSLDYFHSHICGSDPACSAGLRNAGHDAGTARSPAASSSASCCPATGTLAAVPPGHPRGKLLTAPFTLSVQ